MCGPDERWVLRASDQRALDEHAYTAGIDQDALMESAGTNAAKWIERHLRPLRPVILAGPGGNGGDGLVVARRLLETGADVRAFSLVPTDRSSEATRRMAARYEDAGGVIHPVDDKALDETLDRADCVIDGLFGSGLSRPLDREARRIVERLNTQGAKVVSLDLPSGLGSDSGELLGEAVRADVTLAMAFLKPAHLFYPAAGLCGNTAVVDVAYPDAMTRDVEPWARVCEGPAIRRRLPARPPDGHKGTFGRVLVVAGSVGMTGAAILCCRGALRAGAGLVTLTGPASLGPVFETALPEVITIPLPDEEGRLVSIEDRRFREALDRADVLALGPGLSRASSALEAARAIVERYTGPIVLDADGIHALTGDEGALARLADRAILTPHPGELSALTGEAPAEIDRSRRDRARAFAAKHRVVLVLKGRPTAIGLPDGTVYLNPTGHDGLATGGSGDVLTGLIAGLIAGGATLADGAIAGVYLHGLSAEVYARDRASRSLIPSDLLELIPAAIHEVER